MLACRDSESSLLTCGLKTVNHLQREVVKIIGLCNDLKYQSFSTLLNLNSLIVNRIIHVITISPAGMANTKAILSTFGTNVTRMR